MAETNDPLLNLLQPMYGELKFSMIELLERAADVAATKAALPEPGRASTTYRGLLELVRRTVALLNARGLSTRSHVAVAMPSTQEAAAVYISVMAGMTLMPLNPSLAADECRLYLQHGQIDALLVLPEGAAGPREAAEELGILVIEVRPVLDGPAGTFEIMGGDAAGVTPQFAHSEDMITLVPTSGTTALPKLVPWTQQQMALNGYFTLARYNMSIAKQVTEASRHAMVTIVPLHHASGLSTLVISIVGRLGFRGIPVFDVGQIYRELALYGAITFYALPAMLGAMVAAAPLYGDEIAQLKLSSVLVGSAALPDALLQQVQDTLRAAVGILYGLTEVPYVANTVQNTTDPTYQPGAAILDLNYRPGSVGTPSAISKVRIVDEDGAELPNGEIGEIVVRSLNMFKGYWNNPEANAVSFYDGWFRTGDLGYLDADGYLYLTGRVKEVINRGGSKISPLDIDAVLLRHPAVADAAAFGFPHAALGEDIAAAVVLRDPGVSERELRLFVGQHLPLDKVPSRFVFVAELPKTALGKVKRNALVEQFKGDLER